MSSVKSKTISGLKWSSIDRFANKLTSMVIGIVIARLLLPSDYGIVGMTGVFMAVAQSFVDSGFSNALIRKQDRTEKDFSTVFYFNIVVGLVCYGILFLIAPRVAAFFNEAILTDVLRVVGINVFLNSLCVVQVARLTIAIDFKTQAKAGLISSATSGIIGILSAYNGFGVWSLVVQSVSSTIFRVVLLWIFSKWHPQWVFSWNSFKEMFNYGSKLLCAGLLHAIYSNLSTLLIGKFYTPADLGYYSRGAQFPQMVAGNAAGILQRVTFPIFAELQDNDEYLIQVYRKYMRLVSMVIFFLLILLAALGKPVILLLLTPKWLPALIFLQIFCFALFTDHINQINLNLLQVKGRSDLFLRLEILKKTISCLILLASIPFGVLAICISHLIYSQIALFINTYYTGKLFHLSYKTQIKDVAPYFIFSVLACVPAYILANSSWNIWGVISIGTVLSVSLYILLLVFSKDPLFKQYIYEFVKEKLHR